MYLVSVGYWTHVSEVRFFLTKETKETKGTIKTFSNAQDRNALQVPQSYFDALEEIAESARKVRLICFHSLAAAF